ncbi:MAG: hypothetical protein NTX82_05015 [Candidatus Parcubacteria bacterium]|nr:hypothetical protein [Candidatus Parcubacteria bacterium]
MIKKEEDTMLHFAALVFLTYLTVTVLIYRRCHELEPRWYRSSQQDCLKWAACWPLTLSIFIYFDKCRND